MNSKIFVSAFFLSLFLLLSCTSTSNFSAIDQRLAQNDTQDAITHLEENRKKYYSLPRDELLYKLDLAILHYYAENYAQSNKLFGEAEELIFKLYGKSVSQEIGSFLINDNVREYTGEDYEDIYINIFRAMNFLNENNIEGAFVEIRRANNKIKGLNVKYQKDFEKSIKDIEKNGAEAPQFELTEFTNSAIVNYLSILMYRAENDLSNAEVSLRQLEAVYKEQPNIYKGLQIPASIKDDFSVPKDKARLNFLAFTGLSPKKREFSFPFFFLTAIYKIALPEMYLRGSNVASIEIRINNEEIAKMEKIESIEKIALDTFKMQLSVITARAMARTITRIVTTTALDVSSAVVEDSSISRVLSLISFATKITNIATENADIRSTNFFPAHAYVQGITLDEGIYDIDLLFKNANKHVIFEKNFRAVEIKAGKLNLLEAFCTK
ncbi:MAG: hypothetical protein ACRC5H_08005 [Treponemataceae bacterium]